MGTPQQREAPQFIVVQLTVADPEPLEDAIDFVCRRRLWGRKGTGIASWGEEHPLPLCSLLFPLWQLATPPGASWKYWEVMYPKCFLWR